MSTEDLDLELIADDESDEDDAPARVPYPFAASDEQKLRCFIFDVCANREGNLEVQSMERIFQWVRNGATAEVKDHPRRPKAVT